MLSGVTAGGLPRSGDYFEYKFHRHVGDGGGQYVGYKDDTNSDGRYRITRVTGLEVEFSATYTWTYSSSEGETDGGHEDRDVAFRIADRIYPREQDLDEYDTMAHGTLATWFWIPTDVQVGDSVQVLEQTYLVTNRDATVWNGLSPRKGIEVTGDGIGSRTDSYGTFVTSWKDAYYFDAATGFIVAERYEETDSGTYQGSDASFKLTEEFDVTASSYPIAVDYLAILLVGAGILGFVALLGVIAYGIRWRTRSVDRSRAGLGTVRVSRLRDIRKFPNLPESATWNFANFLEDFAARGLLAGDRVAVATSPVMGLLGIAVHNKEADIGLVLAQDTPAAESLRRYVGSKDFFTETRHQTPADIITEAARWGTFIPAEYTYNVFETSQVLKLTIDPTLSWSYDTSLIRRMTPADLPAIGEIATTVYKMASPKWFAAQLAAGDIGVVARLDGRIAGFAFATYAHGHGRLHTLTVLPEFRNRGIGKELVRARLKILSDLGATDVITEIADWNLPSLHIAMSHGFRSVGTMYVETIRTSRIQREIIRR